MGKIIWPSKAISSFNKIIDYLEENWTEKQIANFTEKTNEVLHTIGSGKLTFRTSGKKNVHEVLVTKHNLLIYRIEKDSVELLLFYDTRQNPKKKLF